jgi:hypothetical protein
LLLEASPIRGAIRAGEWKLVYNGHLNGVETAKRGPDRYELFNLSQDPGEKQDVAKRYADIAARLTRRLEAYAGESVPPLYTSIETPPGYRAPEYWARFGDEDKP